MKKEEPLFVEVSKFMGDEDAKRKPRDWGPWKLRGYTLFYNVTRNYRYVVDLERCQTSAQTLDWIAQIAAKTWADDQVVAGLVRALDDVLQLQATRCGCGVEKGPVARVTLDHLDVSS